MATTCHALPDARHPCMKSWSRPGVWIRRRGPPLSTCSLSWKTISPPQSHSINPETRHSLSGHHDPLGICTCSCPSPGHSGPSARDSEPCGVLAYQRRSEALKPFSRGCKWRLDICLLPSLTPSSLSSLPTHAPSKNLGHPTYFTDEVNGCSELVSLEHSDPSTTLPAPLGSYILLVFSLFPSPKNTYTLSSYL